MELAHNRFPLGGEFPPIYSRLRFRGIERCVLRRVILVVACANVASLQLARAISQNELRIRLSLGASRGRVIRQLLAGERLAGFGSRHHCAPFHLGFAKVLVTIAAGASQPNMASLVLHITPDIGIFAYVLPQR